MYILAVDDEQFALNTLMRELDKVFDKAKIHGEKSAISAVKNIYPKVILFFCTAYSKYAYDAYDYEKGNAVAVNSFHGEYMVNYSWAEFSTGKYILDKQGK